MKKTILTFGLISGAIMAAMMLSTMPFTDRIGFDRGMYVGYTSMILALLLVFFGIRSYRDKVGGGQVTFGKAFMVGLGIMVISCLCYVITWEALYFTVLHDFAERHIDKYGAYIVQQVRASGANEAVVQQKMQEMQQFKQMYENPLFNAALTFLEPLPVGLIMTLISAALLRKKRVTPQVAIGQSA